MNIQRCPSFFFGKREIFPLKGTGDPFCAFIEENEIIVECSGSAGLKYNPLYPLSRKI
jgi:hypothetical protein